MFDSAAKHKAFLCRFLFLSARFELLEGLGSAYNAAVFIALRCLYEGAIGASFFRSDGLFLLDFFHFDAKLIVVSVGLVDEAVRINLLIFLENQREKVSEFYLFHL